MHVILYTSGKAEQRVLYPWKIPRAPPEYLSLPSAAATTTSASELREDFKQNTKDGGGEVGPETTD